MKGVLLILLAALAPAAQAAETVGRIFYTPEQRAQLDSLRKQRATVSQTRSEPVPETVTYNGIVRRSDGKAVVWMNNQPLSDAELRSGQVLAGRIGRDGKLTLNSQPGGDGPKIELKVGQSATLLSGKVDESFASQRTVADKPAEAQAAAVPSAKPAGTAAASEPGRAEPRASDTAGR